MTGLKKELSLFGLTMVAVGACIGSGIFKTPAQIAAHLQDPTFILGIWTLGGLVALCGALTFAELGGMFPGAGGLYVYLKKAYGDLVAFLYGWVTLLVITSGAIAALSLVFAEYIGFLIPQLGHTGVRMLAVFAILIATAINILGAKLSETFANIFTILKLLGIGALVLIGVYFAISSGGELDWSAEPHRPLGLSAALALAFVGVLWSFGGWHHVSYLAGEAINPKRTVPFAMVLGALIVSITYLLSNIAYLFLLPMEELMQSSAVAADALEKILPAGGILIAILIAVSTFGTIGIYTLSAPRIYYAMARDGLFFKKLAEVHEHYGTPIYAIMLQSLWAIILLVFWETFENLITYVVFIDWVFFVLVGLAIFVFRTKIPNADRPYRTFGYPIVPLIFVLIALWFLASTLISKPIQAIAGLILLGLGLPVYWLFKNSKTD